MRAFTSNLCSVLGVFICILAEINSLSPSFQLRFVLFFFTEIYRIIRQVNYIRVAKIVRHVRKWANKTNPTVLAFWKKEMGFFFFREKSWYPSDKSTIEMLMDVAALFLGALVFPMKPIHPSIDGGRNYRLSLIRCARCQVSKRWKVPRHRPPPIPIIFLSSSSALLLRKCWIYNTVATSFFSAKYSNVQI